MKKWCMLICVLFFISSASSITLQMKESYKQGETLITPIDGNILEPLKKEDIEFRRKHVLVPLEYDLGKIGDRWFLWAVMPEQENNYSLIIKDVSTTERGRTVKKDFQQNFSVSSEFINYNIKPGFITSRDDFNIEVFLFMDEVIEIPISIPEEKTQILRPGKNTIEFEYGYFENLGIYEVIIGDYMIVAHILPKQFEDDHDEVEIIPQKVHLRFNPERIESVILIGQQIIYPFQIVNLGYVPAENIFLEYDNESFFVNDIESVTLLPGESIEVNLSFIGDVNNELKENGLEEKIHVNVGGFTYDLPIIIRFTEKEKEVETPYLDEYQSLPYCSSINGRVCTAGEICDGEFTTTREGSCCLTKCVEPKSNEIDYGKIIGYGLGFIVILVIFYLFYRYKKTKKGDSIDELKKRAINSNGKLKAKFP